MALYLPANSLNDTTELKLEFFFPEQKEVARQLFPSSKISGSIIVGEFYFLVGPFSSNRIS